MDAFRDNAFYLLLWRAILAGLIGIVLMATSGLSLARALLAGAHVALLFSLGLMIWTGRIDDDGIVRVQAWRLLTRGQWPAGQAGRRVASNYLTEIALRFASVANVAAIGLAASALILVEE